MERADEVQKEVKALNGVLENDHSVFANASGAAIEKCFNEIYAQDKSQDKHVAFKEASEILKELKAKADERPINKGAHLATAGKNNDWFTILPEATI